MFAENKPRIRLLRRAWTASRSKHTSKAVAGIHRDGHFTNTVTTQVSEIVPFADQLLARCAGWIRYLSLPEPNAPRNRRQSCRLLPDVQKNGEDASPVSA